MSNGFTITFKDRRHRPYVNLLDWEKRDVEKSRTKLQTDAYWKDGALHWHSNDAVVPTWVFDEAYCEMPAKQKAAREADEEAFIAQYRKNRSNRVLSDEERFEMRAAFGPGETVVDVFTGQKFTT